MSIPKAVPPQEEKLQDPVPSAHSMAENELDAVSLSARLYGELGDLAKYLDMMLKELHAAELGKTSLQIPYVTGQLSDVTRYTEEQTHQMLEYAEKTMSNHDSMTAALASLKEILASGSPDQVKLKDYVEGLCGLVAENQKILMDLLLALSFQDLAGQRIHKIEVIMQEVQNRILKLVIALGLKARGHHGSKSEPAPLIGTPTAEKLDGPTANDRLPQAMVDGILKEFGF